MLSKKLRIFQNNLELLNQGKAGMLQFNILYGNIPLNKLNRWYKKVKHYEFIEQQRNKNKEK